MQLREYAVHADYAHICKYTHADAAQNPLPHEPHIKAKNEEFWRLEGRQELDQLESLLDQLEALMDQLETLLDQLGTLLD